MNSASRSLAAILSSLAIVLTAIEARADLPMPNEPQCRGKTSGDCKTDDGKDGTCTATKCTRMQLVTVDGSSSRQAVQIDCQLCVDKSAATTSSTTPAATTNASTTPASRCAIGFLGAEELEGGAMMMCVMGLAIGGAAFARRRARDSQ